jgi:hypothetical protein
MLCKPKAEVDVRGTMSGDIHNKQMKLDDITKQRTTISRKCDAAVCLNGGVVCVEAMNQSHGVLF